MSDATLHASAQDPDDFAVQIADQVESFLVAVIEVAKGDEPDSAVPFLLLEVSQLLLAGSLYALYNVSIGIVWLIERGARRESESPLLLLLAAWPALRRRSA